MSCGSVMHSLNGQRFFSECTSPNSTSRKSSRSTDAPHFPLTPADMTFWNRLAFKNPPHFTHSFQPAPSTNITQNLITLPNWFTLPRPHSASNIPHFRVCMHEVWSHHSFGGKVPSHRLIGSHCRHCLEVSARERMCFVKATDVPPLGSCSSGFGCNLAKCSRSFGISPNLKRTKKPTIGEVGAGNWNKWGAAK